MENEPKKKNTRDPRDDSHFWNDIPALFRKYRITLADVKLGEFCGMPKSVTPADLLEGTKLGGSVGSRAAKGMQYLKDIVVAFMNYDDTHHKRDTGVAKWDTPIIPSAANSGVAPVPPRFWYTQVEDYFPKLVQHLGFFDPAGARRRLRKKFPFDGDEQFEALMESERRQGAIRFLKRFLSEYGSTAKKGDPTEEAVISLKTVNKFTRPDLMSYIKRQKIPYKKIAEKLELDTTEMNRMAKEDLRLIVADHHGLLGKFDVKQTAETNEPEPVLEGAD